MEWFRIMYLYIGSTNERQIFLTSRRSFLKSRKGSGTKIKIELWRLPAGVTAGRLREVGIIRKEKILTPPSVEREFGNRVVIKHLVGFTVCCVLLDLAFGWSVNTVQFNNVQPFVLVPWKYEIIANHRIITVLLYFNYVGRNVNWNKYLVINPQVEESLWCN